MANFRRQREPRGILGMSAPTGMDAGVSQCIAQLQENIESLQDQLNALKAVKPEETAGETKEQQRTEAGRKGVSNFYTTGASGIAIQPMFVLHEHWDYLSCMPLGATPDPQLYISVAKPIHLQRRSYNGFSINYTIETYTDLYIKYISNPSYVNRRIAENLLDSYSNQEIITPPYWTSSSEPLCVIFAIPYSAGFVDAQQKAVSLIDMNTAARTWAAY